MNYFILCFFLISILLYIITTYYLGKNQYHYNKRNEKIEAFETEKKRTTAEKLKIYHTIEINYLDISTAQQLVIKNSEYLQGMNQANLSARHCLNIDELYTKYKNGFDTITSKEKETVDEFILILLNKLKILNTNYYYYVCKWLKKISIAKAQSWLEAGMPHTLENTIVMDAKWFINPRKTTLLHELTHIHQRQVEFEFEDLYKALGYEYYPVYIKGMDDIYALNRNNPDGLSKYWLWKMPKNNDSSGSSAQTHYWWIGAIFKTITPTSLSDINLVALKLDKDNEGNFYYLKQHPTLLNTWKPFITFFGDNPNNYHPNEMTAKFAELYLLDILNDTSSNFKNNKNDKNDKNDEGYKIYKTYFENMIEKYK